MSTPTSDYSDVVQARSEFTCECGSQFVKLTNGTFVCAKTVERFKALHGYEPGARRG